MLDSSLSLVVLLAIAQSSQTTAPPSATIKAETVQESRQDGGPAVDEVRTAVLEYFGTDEKSAKAKQDLAEWGDAALPALRKLANDSLARREGHSLTVSIGVGETRDSIALLVEILTGETKVAADYALTELNQCVESSRVRRFLRDSEDFKPAALRFAKDRSWLNRGYFASIAARMKWKDTVPLIEPMVRDKNHSLRITAAKALSKLTGERVEADQREPSFPDQKLVNGLVGPPRSLSVGDDEKGSFIRDFDGNPRLCLSGGKGLQMFAAGEQEGQRTVLEYYCIGALAFPHAGSVEHILALTSSSPFGKPDHVSAINSDGAVAWTYQHEKSGVAGAALLHTTGGVKGAVIAIGSQLVALDHEGVVLWKREEFTPAYELVSHRDLPGVLYSVFGTPARFEVSESNFKVLGGRIRTGVYASHGELFPDASSRPALVIAGAGDDSVPTVARVNEDGKVLWRAILQGRIGGLTMIEAPGRRPLFAVTDTAGRLCILDEDGTLLHVQTLPDEGPQDSQATYDLVAGEIAPGEWAIYLRLLRGSYLYPVDLSKL